MALQEESQGVISTQNLHNDTETVQEKIFKKSRSAANHLREKGVYYIKKKRTTKQMPSIKELSPAEQELRRQMWRLSSQKYRERKMRRMKQQEFITELHSMVDNDTTTGEQDFLKRMYNASKTEPIEIRDEGPAEMESDTQCDVNISCPATLVQNDFDLNSSSKLNVKKRRRERYSEPAETVRDRYSNTNQTSTSVHQVFGNFSGKELRNHTSLSNTETIEIQDEDGSAEVESDTQCDVNISYPATSLIRNDYDLNSALKLNVKKRYSEPAETLLDRYLNITQKSSDEHQVFGDFVAQELRNISSDHLRKQLRRLIQRDILLVAEIEDQENSDNYAETNSLN